MNGSLLEILTENERLANRSCAVVGLWTAAVVFAVTAIGLTGAFYISRMWMLFYFAAIVLPMLAIVAYAKHRDYRGPEIKFLMVLGSALIPVGMAVPSLFGFFLMALPLVVAGRYFSRKFVWETYAMVVCLTVVAIVPHAAFGLPSIGVDVGNLPVFRRFVESGVFDRRAYWSALTLWCLPSFVLCLGFFAIVMSRLCRDEMETLAHQAKVHARLADVEKGLAIAATMEVMMSEVQGAGNGEIASESLSPSPDLQSASVDVSDWSTAKISECIARCKERAAADPEFAALVERDPMAAVKEMQS